MPDLFRADRSTGLAGAIVLGALAALGTGCSSTAPPDLSVADVTISDETPQAMVLTFAIEGTNPNPFPLPLGEVRYQLDLDGRRVFEGTRSAQITIPRSGAGSVELPAAFELSAIDRTLDGDTPYRIVGSIRYRPDGTFPGVLYDSNLYRPSRSFSVSGVLDFSAATRTGPFPEDQPTGPSIRADDPDSP